MDKTWVDLRGFAGEARRIAAGSPLHRSFERYDWTFGATLIKRGPVECDALSGETAGESRLRTSWGKDLGSFASRDELDRTEKKRTKKPFSVDTPRQVF